MAEVECRGVSKTFGDVRAVDDVDLQIRDGELLVLLGPSGSGKTTLMRLCAGLEEPSGGDDRHRRRRWSTICRRAGGRSPWSSRTTPSTPTRRSSTTSPSRCEVQGDDKEEIRQKVEWAAGLFNIGHLLERRPSQLSGGSGSGSPSPARWCASPRSF